MLMPGDIAYIAKPTLAQSASTLQERWLKYPTFGLVIARTKKVFVSSGVDWDFVHIMTDGTIYIVPERCCSNASEL